MERPKCETCPYYHNCGCHDEMGDIGECRLSNPKPWNTCYQSQEYVQDYDDGRKAFWPVVHHYDWCGQHPDFPAHIASLKRPAPARTIDVKFPLGIIERKTLARLGVTSIEKFRGISMSQLLSQPNCGIVRTMNIIKYMASHGIVPEDTWPEFRKTLKESPAGPTSQEPAGEPQAG